MSNYQVKLLIISKADRRHFNYLNLNAKKYHSIAVIDEYLKHIEDEVRKSYKNPVKLRFHLVEIIDTDDGKKQEKVELGSFEYDVQPDKSFVSENRFHQIVETDLYLNNSNVDDAYKEEILKNIEQSKTIMSEQNESSRSKPQKKFRIKETIVNTFLKKKTDVSEPEERSENLFEDLEDENKEPELFDKSEEVPDTQTEDETREYSESKNSDETVSEDIEADDDDKKEREISEADTENNEVTEDDKSIEAVEEKTQEKPETRPYFEDISFDNLIDIPDFKLPKVKSRDLFLKQSDDPVENKRLSFLFDRETRLASYKEQSLVEIYHDLVDKYHNYLFANEQDIDAKLEEYEQTRETFVEQFIYPFKEKMNEKLEKTKQTIEQQKKSEHDDFVAQQKQALHRFEEQQNSEEEEKINEYKVRFQNEIIAEKEKANQKFEEKKEDLKKELTEKVKADVYNYVLLGQQTQIQKLNNEVFEYDEETYRQLDEKIKVWQTELENKQQQEKMIQEEGLAQAKYEAEKEKAQSDILSIREKERELEANAQRLQAQELEQKQNEMAYQQEEQRLKAIEVDAKQKTAEAKKREAERMIPMSVRKIGGIVAGAVLVLFVLIMFAFQLFFNDESTYAELIDEEEYVEAYERYPNRFDDLLQTAYDNGDSETINYLAEQSPENTTAELYQAIIQGQSQAIMRAYQNIGNPEQLDDDILMIVANQYLSQQNIQQAQAVSAYMNDPNYSERIAEVENYMNIKEELEQVIEESDDDEEVENAENTLAQIDAIFNNQEDTE
ncbi:hypothetical protein [Salinicoccus kekensis]|uniref:Uncharacterized protein n=1 Tax=Salinicoccus kekensis TaxID=714307 RepID=A0A285UTB9_9STAP|nr:hypothetical protein [Salinicoccus kekensis]SOC45072.1 hypothetical protein SAMN05878391_2582 [Salinicoccus kekensis]